MPVRYKIKGSKDTKTDAPIHENSTKPLKKNIEKGYQIRIGSNTSKTREKLRLWMLNIRIMKYDWIFNTTNLQVSV